MGQLLEIEEELIELGYRIVAVSPDRPAELSKTIDINELTYTLLSDSSMVGAQSLGIAKRFGSVKVAAYKLNNQNIETASGQDHHLIPVPSVYIIGKDGIIRFAHTDENHRKRILISDILATANKISKE